MLSLHWLSQLWSSRRSQPLRRERTKERRLKLLRLEQRRVLNADFSFTPQTLTLSVDGDLTVREVSSGLTSRIEFDLHGSVWQDDGSTGTFAIDNSTPGHSILSLEKSDFENLSGGASLIAASSSFDLQFDVQSSSLDLSQMRGTLVVEGFGSVSQTASSDYDVRVADVSLSASHIDLSSFYGDDITLNANEIDLNGGEDSFSGTTLSILSAATPAIELGGFRNDGAELNFTDRDIAALDSGFTSIHFNSMSTGDSSSLTVDESGADFSDALSSHALAADDRLGSLRLEAATIQIHGDLTSNGGLIEIDGTDAVTVSATGAVISQGGEVHLDAGEHGTLLVSGGIDVSDTDAGDSGGTVYLLGERIGLFGDARVEASGDAGGGEVLIGGDNHGANDAIRNASAVWIGSDVEVHADAIQHGNGGKVVVWSDETTQYFGSVTARGGSMSGDGGLIETSSLGQLILSGSGDASAANGHAGTWLLDPYNVAIRHTLSGFGVDDSGQLPNFTPTASGSEVTDTAIEAQLNAGTNVVISTANAAGGEAGNVTQSSDASIDVIFAASGNTATFTINAANNIQLDGGITAANGTLDVVLNANTVPDDPDLGSGNVDVNATINTNGGTFSSSGVNFDNTGSTITATGGATITQTGTVVLGAIDAGAASLAVTAGGNITDEGAVTVGGNASFTTTQANTDITLDLLQLTGTLALSTNGANGDATIVNATGINFAASSVEGNLTATATSGDITDSGAVIVGHDASFTTQQINDDILLNQLQLTGLLALSTSGANADATVVNATGINFAATNVGNNLTATATTGNITDSGTVIVGGNASFATSQAGDDIDLNSLQLIGTLALSTLGATSDATIVNTTSIDFAATDVGGDLAVTASTGDITDSAPLSVGGNASFETSAGGDITIAAAGSVHFGTLTFNSRGAVRIAEDSATVLSGTSTAVSLNLSSTDAITNDGTANVTVDENATVQGANISLGEQLGDAMRFGTLTFLSTGAVGIAEDDGTQLSGRSTAVSLNLSSSDAITDDGTASVSVVSNATFSGISITLDDFYQFGSLTFLSDGAVEISEADATILSGISTAASLNVTSNDAITNNSTADVSVTNDATFNGTRITLGDQAGDTFNFGTLAFVSTGIVSIAEDSSTVLSGTSSALSLSLSSSNEITNDGLARVTVDNNATFSGTLIMLGDQAGDILRFGSLTFVSTGAVRIAQDSDIVLSGNSSALSLNLQSTDTIRSDGTANVLVEDNATFAGTRITLNNFNQFGTVTFVSGGDVAITEADATVLSGSSTALSLSLSSGDTITNLEAASVSVENNVSFSGASITLGDQLGDAMNFGSLTVNSAGDVQIAEDSDLFLTGTSTAQNLNLSSTDVILNDGSASVSVVDNATFNGTNIDLGNQSGDAMSFGTLTFVADGFARIAVDSAAVLSGTSTATSLELSSDSEIANDGSANVTIAGNATFSSDNITLNDFYQFGSLTFLSTGAVAITEADATTLSGISTALTLSLSSPDTIGNDGSAEVTVENNASFSGLSITLDDTYHFGSLTFTSPGAVDITEADAMLLDGNSTANSLNLVSSGSITEEVGGTLTVTETTNLVGFSGSVILDGANDFGRMVTLTSGDAATLNDVNSVTLGDSTVASLFTITANDSIVLEGNVTAGSASWFAANGSISGAGKLTATSVKLDASTGIFGASSDDSLSISALTISADNSGAFDVRLSNDNVLDVTVTSLTTLGGNLDFAQTGFGSVTFTGPVASGDQGSAVPVAGGDITLTSTGGLTVAAFDQPLSSESGTGGTLSLSGATIQRAINVGAGNITINGAGDDLLITADIFANASIELSATGDIVITSTITANGATSDLTITADSDFDGVGGFWLNEGPSATDARLNAGQNIAIQGSNLLATVAAGDGIRIDGDGDAQQVVAGGDLSLSTIAGSSSSNSGDIVIDGRQTADGSITVSSNRNTFLGADQTSGTEMLFQTAVRLTNDLTLTTGGDLTFFGTLDDDGSSATGSALTIDAGEDVVFAGVVGAIVGDRLDTLTVADSESVEFQSTVTIDGDLVVVTTLSSGATAGTISFADDVTTTAGLATGSVEITNSGLLLIAPGADFSLAGSFTQNGPGSTELGGNITTDNGGISFDRALLLTESVRLDSSNRSGDITFLGPVDSEGSAGSGEHNSLTLASGAGTISFNGDIGAGDLGDQELGNLTVVTAGMVLFGGADAGGPGTTGPVTTIATDGVIDIGTGDHVIAGGIVLNAGSGTLVITTTDDSVRFNGPVVLSSNVDIDTNFTGTGGTVTFTSSATVDSQFGESNGLTIDAGTQRVLFNNDIGLINAIGALNITQADSGVIFGESDADQGPGSTGPVATLATEGPIDIGVGSNVILGGIVFNAGSGTLQISAADETVRFNGAVTLNSNVSINTNIAGFGGTVTFTSNATIDSQNGEHHDLTIDAGTQQVLFNNDLGAIESLGALTITQADGGVIFGESDTNLGPGMTGPVTTISTDGAIDIGVAEHVITGGIVLNAGSGTLQITTTDDSVRFNGPVTLSTHLDINTNSAGIGGTVTFTNTATIDSEIGEHNDLRINAGTQQVQFNNDIGAVQSIGALTITQADSGVTFGQPVTFGASDVDQRPGTTGPVIVVNTDDAIDIGVGSNVIGGVGIVLNAGVDMLTITTTDDAVRFNGAVTLASGVTINTNATGLGGTVTFTSAAAIDSQTDEHNDLIIDAGSQQVLFNNNIGAVQSLGVFTILQAEGGVFFGEADTDQGPGTIGPVAIISTDGAIEIGVAENVIAGSGIVVNAGTQTLQITTTDDTVRLNGAVSLLSSLDIDTNATPLTGGGTVTFTSAATIDGDFGESNSLTIDVGTQQVLFNNDIGNNDPIGSLTITQADGGVVFGQADADQGPGTTGPVTTIITEGPIDIGVGANVITGGIVLNAGDGTMLIRTTDDIVRFNGPVTLESAVEINTNLTPLTGGGTVTFTSSATIDSEANEHNDLTIDVGSQQVLFNNNVGLINPIGALIITQADSGVIFGQTDTDQGPGTTGPVSTVATDGEINIGVGPNVVSGGIVLNAGSGTMTITTTDDSVRFNGPVTLLTDVDINSNIDALSTGGGTVTFTSSATIDSQTGEHYDLTIDAGTERVLFNNNLGATQSLGALTITQADSGVIFGETDTDEGPGTTGPVTTINTDESIDIGVGPNVITFGIVLNAGIDEFGVQRTQQITTTDDTIRFNGPVTLSTAVDIDTNFTAVTGGATVTFTSGATVDSQADEHNDLTIDVGTQQVLFNNSIGGVFSLGAFTISQADTGVIFGEADTDQGPGTIGPVTTISTDRAIDIGVGTNVIDGAVGIVFNAGTETLLVMTTDDTVRFNGAITLASAVEIDTNFEILTGGGRVTFTVNATIDSAADEFNNLTIDAGIQEVVFNNDLGATQPLGEFTIIQADGGVIFGESDTNEGPGTTGPVTIIATDGAIDIGVLGNIINGGIIFNGGVDPLLLSTTDDPARFNGQITLASDVEIDTNDIGFGGTVTFTSSATIDSQGDEQRTLTIDAGAQQVLFNNNIGENVPLGALTITQADGGITFGESGTDLGAGTTGPVSTVTTTGPIDLGVDDNIIFGGIVLNAGIVPITIESLLDRIRVNGPVTSLVDVILRAAEGITLTDEADITTTDHNIEIFGDTDDTRVDDPFTDAIAMSFDTFIDSGNGYIHMNAASVLLGSLISTNTGATTDEHPAVHVTATTGAITDINSNVDEGIDFVNITANALPTVANLQIGLTDAETTFVVNDTNVTLDVPFTIQIEQEQMMVTAVAGDTLTVTRGVNGTTAAAHDGSVAAPITVFAVTPGAGVVLEAVTGIGSGDALETEVDTLLARNMDARDMDGNVLVTALGNIQIVEVSSGGDLNLINVRNEANATFDADPDNGVVDVTIERDPDMGAVDGSLIVLDDELGAFDATDLPYGLLAELKGDPALLVIPGDRMGVQSENIIRLTAFNITINDDVLAITDADGGTTYETIEIHARGNFALAANRVISTDENFVNSLPQGDPTKAEPVGGEPPSEFPTKPRVTDDRVRIVADFDHVDHADAGNVFLGRSSTISTDAGIQQDIARRPAPNEAGTAFFDSETVHTSDLNSNGLDSGGSKYLGFLTITIGKPGEKNLILDIDWGDTPRSTENFDEFPLKVQDLLTQGLLKDFNSVRESKISDEVGMSANVLSDSNVNAPHLVTTKYFFDQVVDKDKTRFFIPEGGLTYVIPHEYSSMALNRPNDLREPERFFPSDPFQVRFSVSQHPSINIQGRAIQEPTIGPPATAPLAAVKSSSPIAPLALLSSTDILEDNLANDHGPDIDYTTTVIDSTPDFYRDEANFRLNSGVAEFNVPTTKALKFIDNTQPIVSPEPPRAVARDTSAITAPQLTTESLRGSAASASVTTDEFFELHLINEDGTITIERLRDGEGLLERENFENFVRDRGDGDYEIWFITRENGTGARIERPVIQFRLEGGRLTPPANDSQLLIKPFRLVPVPVPPPQQMPEGDAADELPNDSDAPDAASRDSNSAEAGEGRQSPDSAAYAASLDSDTAAYSEDHWRPEFAVLNSEPPGESDSDSDSSNVTSAVAGALVFYGQRWWQNRSSQPGTSRFSLSARLARKRSLLVGRSMRNE